MRKLHVHVLGNKLRVIVAQCSPEGLSAKRHVHVSIFLFNVVTNMIDVVTNSAQTTPTPTFPGENTVCTTYVYM